MKMRLSFLAAAALTALAGPAAARCSQPYAPVVKITASATKEDVESLRADVAAFIAASDVYQTCLIAARDRTRISANQLQKERIVGEFNNALRSFKASRSS